MGRGAFRRHSDDENRRRRRREQEARRAKEAKEAAARTKGVELATLCARHFQAPQRADLSAVGWATNRVHRYLGREDRTRPFVATTFWQAFISSDGLSEALRSVGIPPTDGSACIVAHGSRHDLAYFTTQAPPEPVGVPVTASPDDLADAWHSYAERRELEHDPLTGRSIDRTFQGAVAAEAAAAGRFGMLVARPPKLVRTASPQPAWAVVADEQSAPSTAGVCARNADGIIGVTAALHAVGNNDRVLVNGRAAAVLSRDVISDSCFLKLARTRRPPGVGKRGPLRAQTPRGNQRVWFEGVGSRKRVSTVVTGWTPDIPYVSPLTQLRVLTKPSTVRGDSGAALVDDDDYIIGFAFARSAYGEPIEFATWIWAHSVFQAHGLAA